MNAFHWNFNLIYYIKHPIKACKEFSHNVRDSYHRIKYGWAYPDAWNFDTWFLDVVPQMLRAIAADISFPQGFENHEDWEQWLLHQAEKLECCREDGIVNEFEEDFHRLSYQMRKRVKNEDGTITTSYDDSVEFSDLRKKFFAREKEIYDEKCQLISEVFSELSKNFFDLWS